jgi:hypothetical protein
MPDPSMTYMGIGLKNPLIVGACNLMKKNGHDKRDAEKRGRGYGIPVAFSGTDRTGKTADEGRIRAV